MDSNDKLRLTNMLQEYHSMRRERNFIASVKLPIGWITVPAT